MTKDWNNETIPLLFDAPGASSKYVHWIPKKRKPKEVNSLVETKDDSKSHRAVRKSHLSRDYQVDHGVPLIPKPAFPPDTYLLRTYPIHNYRSIERLGKPPDAPKRPICPQLNKKSYVEEEVVDGGQVANSNKWIMHIDPSDGWPYYYNQTQNYSTYEKPEEYRDDCIKPAQDLNDDQIDSTQEYDLSNDWIEYWDEEVEALYYYNQVTGEASWMNPTSLAQE